MVCHACIYCTRAVWAAPLLYSSSTSTVGNGTGTVLYSSVDTGTRVPECGPMYYTVSYRTMPSRKLSKHVQMLYSSTHTVNAIGIAGARIKHGCVLVRSGSEPQISHFFSRSYCFFFFFFSFLLFLFASLLSVASFDAFIMTPYISDRCFSYMSLDFLYIAPFQALVPTLRLSDTVVLSTQYSVHTVRGTTPVAQYITALYYAVLHPPFPAPLWTPGAFSSTPYNM